jgi:predicted transcriptional regulator
MQGEIHARVILEMLGGPKEYIEKTLKDYIQKLKKDLQIIKEDYEEAKEQGKMFSTFVELEIKFKDTLQLLDFCFEALPSSVEILSPEEITFKSNDLTDFFNDLQSRLHEADMVVKSVRAQNKILDRNATAVLQNFIKYIVKKPKTAEEISPIIGMEPKNIKAFADELLKKGVIKEKDGKYSAE